MRAPRVAVIGAGIAGLACAVDLAAKGVEVVVLERAGAPGGKLREIEIDGRRVDAGPTVFTMRRVFDELFEAAGADFSARVNLRPLEILARHAWEDGARLDLFADRDRSAEAIAALAGPAEGRRYLAFCDAAERIFKTVEGPFIRAATPSVAGLVQAVGLRKLGDLWQIQPFATMWQALEGHFSDPRLRQLFGRYATYCGSSPFQAPATLMLVAHVEQAGVWMIVGGMHRLAVELERLASERGARFRYTSHVQDIVVEGGGVVGVTLADGERLEAEAVVSNADVAALAAGRFGRRARAALAAAAAERSLSAVTWALVAEAEGFPLVHHNVFFSADYPAEFADIFERRRLPRAPTVYVCAQDREEGRPPPTGRERLLCLVNAPATGDSHPFEPAEIASCAERTFGLMERSGLRLRREPARAIVTTPRDFEQLFPATGGALYGRASHGWRASFARPTARSRIPGLYLAGGSTHPGPGVPMAALSGRLAAASLLADLGSTGRSRRTAMSGGTSTR